MMRNIFKNKRGEGHIDTALKIIIGVVIGALILGGLYLLFAGDGGVVDNLNAEVEGMMDYTQELRVERAYDEERGKYYLRYSYDGRHWSNSEIPTYSETTTVYGLASNGSEESPIDAALLQDGTRYYVITSTDGGITWEQKFTFTATNITHFYFGTSDRLPNTSGSYSGEKFALRYSENNGSSYVTVVSNGISWSRPTWGDLILF